MTAAIGTPGLASEVMYRRNESGLGGSESNLKLWGGGGGGDRFCMLFPYLVS